MAVKIVSCPTCEMKYRLDPAKFPQKKVRIRCKKCESTFEVDLLESPPPPSQEKVVSPEPSPPSPSSRVPPLILVAHEQKEMQEEIGSLLKSAGYEVLFCEDGVSALMQIIEKKPPVAILDVALPRMFGFEVCEVVRRDPALDGTKIVLVAAIFDRTRYKRSPETLYGADDYIEKHHIPDSLLDKVQRLLERREAPPLREEKIPRLLPEEEEKEEEKIRERIREIEDKGLPQEVRERAQRLARIIISDIALYNQEKIEKGIREGNLREVLKEELKEGNELMKQKLKGELEDFYPFLHQALEEFIQKKTGR